MKNKYACILFLLLICPMVSVSNTLLLDSLFVQMDYYIDKSDVYIRRKEDKIKTVRQNLFTATNDNQRFMACHDLYEEYKSYKYDSAYVYANKSLDAAFRLNNQAYIDKANEAIAFCLLSSGLFKEAFEVTDKINAHSLDDQSRKDYYMLQSRLCYDIADYNREEPFKSNYIKKGNQYSDSILQIVQPGSLEWQYAYGLLQMKQENYPQAVTTFTSLLTMNGIDDHLYAMTASALGYIYWLTGKTYQAKIYTAKAVIADITSATKETTALRTLAGLLYETGDINRANKYIKLAMEDANFYNARHRKIEISSILPIIEKERFEAVEKQRNMLVWFVVSVLLLFLLLSGATVIIYKQMKKLQVARYTIEKRQKQLQQTNSQLTEANNIKDEYIGFSFYVNSEYISKIENLYKLVNRKITARQYDDLRVLFRESDLRKERENMYVSFDETFLKLFPTFISSYNNLFQSNDRTHSDAGKILTAEMRIFALIRLGIFESERIAKFLNYSVNTINTYKTKVKNKSIVPNEHFEQKIMEIKSGK